MAECLVLSLLDAAPGRQDELVDWFATTGPGVAARSGAASVQLLRATNPEGGAPPPEYAALWAVDTPGAGPAGVLVPPAAAAGHVTWAFAARGAVRNPRVAPGGPARDILLVLNDAAPGREAEFDAWYRERHIADTFRVLGFTRARRYRRVQHGALAPAPYGFMAIYDVPDGELGQCVERYARSRAERTEALATGREAAIPLSPAQGGGRFVHWYRRVTDVLPAA